MADVQATQNQFESDFQQVLDALNSWQGATVQTDANTAAYQSALGEINISGSVMDIGAMWIHMFMAMGNEGCNMLMGDMNETAYLMDVLQALTNCANDIQTLTNDTNTGNNAGQSLDFAAEDMDQMLDLFGAGTSDEYAGYTNLLTEALGSSVCSSMTDNYEAMRSDIFVIGDDSGYNPDENSSYHFKCDANNANYTDDAHLNSYGQAWDLSATSGDQLGATEAIDNVSNSLNMILTTTQNANESEQAILTNQSNQLQTVESFVAYGCQNMITELQAYTKGQIPA